jgi:hypothetical protein
MQLSVHTAAFGRRLLAAAALGLALAAAGCSDDNSISAPRADRTYNQVQRLGNPLVSEVFLAKREHPHHAAIGPQDDMAAFGDQLRAFVAAFGRDATVQNTLATVLLPDMLIVQTDKDPSTAGWLSSALADGYGGRRLQDDVVDAGLSAIFGQVVSSNGALCANFSLPLCTDNVGPHSYDSTFPYLRNPN